MGWWKIQATSTVLPRFRPLILGGEVSGIFYCLITYVCMFVTNKSFINVNHLNHMVMYLSPTTSFPSWEQASSCKWNLFSTWLLNNVKCERSLPTRVRAQVVSSHLFFFFLCLDYSSTLPSHQSLHPNPFILSKPFPSITGPSWCLLLGESILLWSTSPPGTDISALYSYPLPPFLQQSYNPLSSTSPMSLSVFLKPHASPSPYE